MLFTAQGERINFREFRPTEVHQQDKIIDVRTTAEFQRGHLDGAFSFHYTRLKTRLDELPKNRRFFIHCGTGKRAPMAAFFLTRALMPCTSMGYAPNASALPPRRELPTKPH
jgi:hydroxyacylglutathione hydrolase